MLPYPTLPRPRFDAPTQHLRLCALDERQLHNAGVDRHVLMLPYPSCPPGLFRRSLGMYSCALMTSGSFTMMASAGLF